MKFTCSTCGRSWLASDVTDGDNSCCGDVTSAPAVDPEVDTKTLDLFNTMPTPTDDTAQADADNGKIAPPQIGLFGDEEHWEEAWRGMPEFVQNDLAPFKTVYVHFENVEDMRAFATLIGQTLTMQTRSVWYPAAEIGRIANKRYVDAAFASKADRKANQSEKPK